MRNASWEPVQQTMMTNVAALESRSAAIASPALVASSPTPLSILKSLTLENIEDLRSLPGEGLRNLISLKDLSIESCKRLETLSYGIQHLTTLQTLRLGNCIELDLGKDEDWMEGQGLKGLHTLTIDCLPKLVSLPSGFQHLTTLQELKIKSCRSLMAIPEWIHNWTSLEEFSITGCSSLTSLPKGICRLTSLRKLMIFDCIELDLGKDEDWMQWQELKSLQVLVFFDIQKLVSLPSGFQHLTTVRRFSIGSCPSLTAIPEWIHNWTSLKEFSICRCPSLTSLPEGMRRLTSLQILSINSCPILLQRCERHRGEDWPKIAHIPDLRLW